MDLQVSGAEQLERVAKRLKAAGDKEMRSELMRGLGRAAKPMQQTAKKTPLMSPGLPRSGGLARLVAGNLASRGVKVKRSTSGRNVGVRISGSSSGHDIRSMNRGRLRHPTHGGRPWVDQKIPEGFWDKPLLAEVDKARREVIKVIEDIAKKIGR